jgi:hypothetical protein
VTILQFIQQNKLQPADAVELACPQKGFPFHYAIYLGNERGNPRFIANITNGVQIISERRLLDFMTKYQVTNIERFQGSILKRKQVIKKALSRIGEKAYNLVFNNCEHFKNWVLYGESKSRQVENIGAILLADGFGLVIAGTLTNKKALRKLGNYIIDFTRGCIDRSFLFAKERYLTPSATEIRKPSYQSV